MCLNKGNVVRLCAIFGFLGVVVAPLEAQRLIPQIGVYSAVEAPGSVQGPAGAYDIARYESTLAYGGAIEFGGDTGVGLRFSGLYAPKAETAISGSGCVTGCPADVDLLSVMGSLVVRPLGNVFFLEPYLVGGGGLKRFNFEPEGFGDGVGQVFSDASEWGGLLGVGAEVNFGGLTVITEVADHFHWSDRGIVNGDKTRMDDFFFTVGLVLGR
ncbi:MAG: hypothetical protein ACR2QM_17560 [Longimicrobiales bacterium]